MIHRDNLKTIVRGVHDEDKALEDFAKYLTKGGFESEIVEKRVKGSDNGVKVYAHYDLHGNGQNDGLADLIYSFHLEKRDKKTNERMARLKKYIGKYPGPPKQEN